MSTATVDRATVADNADYTDLRRITEDDPDYQRLHAQTVARLQRSLRQYIREEQRGEQGADSRFIQRHITLMREAYEAAHKEGQRDYWPAVSNRTVQHRYIQPATEQTQKRLTYYALGSIMKLAHQVKSYVQQQKSGTLGELSSYTFDDLPSEYDSRVALQATITWSGLQDGYSTAGASDSATPYSLLYWNLGPVKTQHCSNCPTLAMNSPYDPPWAGVGSNQLNQTPGDGQTECGAGCKCSLDYSAPAEGSAALAELNAAKAQQWQDFMSFDGSPLPAITQAGVPGAPAAGQARVFTPLQKQYMDTHRNLAEQWNEARGNLPPAPDMFRRPDLSSVNAPRTPWGVLTPYQQNILDRMTQNEIDWLHAVGQLNWPTPPYIPDIETKFAGWMKQAASGTFTPWWKDYTELPAQEQELAAWLDEVAKSNRWPTPPPLDEDAAMREWMAKVAQSVEWPPDSSQLSEDPDWLPTIELYNPYPRQKGGRFGYGPGGPKTGTGSGTKGTGGTAKKSGGGSSKTKTAKVTVTTGGGSLKAPSVEEQKAAAELRVKTAQTRANKATRDFNKAEKEAASKQINNKDEIARLQAVQHEAFINEFHSYTDAKDAIAEERAQAKAGKAPKTYEKMMAAKQPYEEAKASYEAAKATSDASRAIHDELQSRYIQQYDFSNMRSYDKMMKDHPDLKAADKQRWADQRVTDKAQTAFYRAQSKYTGPRDKLAGNIDDAAINAYPSRIAAKAALADANARLGEANGQTALRTAFDARESARLELKDAQQGLAHPTWKYALNSAPTTHAQYTNLQAWPQSTLQAAQSAGGRMTNDRHEGDLALAELQQAQGFNGKPDIVTEAELNGYVKGGEVEIWRGDTRSDHTDNLMVGDYHAGLGIRGNGTYAQEGANGISTARSYAQAHGKDGLITRMSVKADARVIGYDELRSQAHTAAQHYQQEEQSARTRGDTAGVRRAKTLGWVASSDSSRYAVALGYDAVRIPSHGQWIILNRTSVRISHQVRGGGAT